MDTNISDTPLMPAQRLSRAVVGWLLSTIGNIWVCIPLGAAPFVYNRLAKHNSWSELPIEVEVLFIAIASFLPIFSYFAEQLKRLIAFDQSLRISHDRVRLEEVRRWLPVLTEELVKLAVPITVSNFHNFLAYLPLYLAEDLGYFEQERIDVRVQPSGNDLEAIRKLVDGSADIAITDPMYAFSSPEAPPQAKIIAPFLRRAAVWVVSKYDLDQLPSTSLRALTFSKQSTAYLLASSWCSSRRNISLKAIEPIGGEKFSNYLKRFLSEEAPTADLLFVAEPEASWLSTPAAPNAAKVLAREMFPYARCIQRDVFGDEPYMFTAVMARQEFIDRHRLVVFRFLKAYRLALMYLASAPRLPASKGADELRQFIDTSEEWEQIVQSVKKHVVNAYPKDFLLIPSELLVSIIDYLRSHDFFPRSIYLHHEDVAAFNLAFKNRFAGDANWQTAHSDIASHFKEGGEKRQPVG